MKDNKKDKVRKIYLNKTWVEVSEEDYKIYYRDLWALHSRMQYHGLCCLGSSFWKCNGDCVVCEFYRPDTESLDKNYSRGAERSMTLYETVSGGADVEEAYLNSEFAAELSKVLSDLSVRESVIADFIKYGVTERDAAEVLGVTRHRYRVEKLHLLNKLRHELEEWYYD